MDTFYSQLADTGLVPACAQDRWEVVIAVAKLL